MKKLPIALALSIVFAIAGCSSSSSGGGAPVKSADPQATDAASKAAATTVIKSNWATFFDSNTPQPTAVGLLENGSSLGPAVTLAAKIAKKDKTKESAVVTKVTFAGPSNANIKYNLLGNGKPLLSGSDGKAVLQGGTWKVSQVTFCTLVALGAQGKKVPGCS